MAVFSNQTEALDYTQRIRKEFVEKTLATVPIEQVSSDDIKQLMAVLGDMDKQTLTLAKIDAENENQAENRRVAMMAAELNKGVLRNPFQCYEGEVVGAIPDPGAAIELIEGVVGETVIGTSDEKVSDFLKRTGRADE